MKTAEEIREYKGVYNAAWRARHREQSDAYMQAYRVTHREELSEYNRRFKVALCRRRRAEKIAQLGGQCVVCGGSEKLEFDHVDPSTKTFTIGSRARLIGPSAVLNRELQKCQLLCHVHHMDKTVAERSQKRRGVARK